MFNDIYEAIEYLEDYDIYTDMSLSYKGQKNFTGNDFYLKEDNRKAYFEVETRDKKGMATLVFGYLENGEIRYYEIPFQFIFTFVINRKNLYVGHKIIPLETLQEIYIKS